MGRALRVHLSTDGAKPSLPSSPAPELRRPQVRFPFRKELVQLRRLHRRPRQHGMGLPAMVDLVLEEMHQQPVAPLHLHPHVAVHPHLAVERLVRQRVADSDQAPVHRRLFAFQVGEGRQGISFAQALGPSIPPSRAST